MRHLESTRSANKLGVDRHEALAADVRTLPLAQPSAGKRRRPCPRGRALNLDGSARIGWMTSPTDAAPRSEDAALPRPTNQCRTGIGTVVASQAIHRVVVAVRTGAPLAGT